MYNYIKQFMGRVVQHLEKIPYEEVGKAIHIIESVYERDGRIYIFGNGGSLSIATHWVSDFNKTVFSHQLGSGMRRFQAIRLPTTEEELSAWANDEGYDMVFAGPLKNYMQDNDCVIAISSSGKSQNIIKAVELAKARHVPVIGLSGFDGGKLNKLANAKILVKSKIGAYGEVESVHNAILHLLTSYFQDYFDHLIKEKHGK